MQKNSPELPPLYITLDVEAAGHRLGHHSTLSIGAAVVSRTPRTFDEYTAAGHIFYTELKPIDRAADMEAMRIGCLHLICLEDKRRTDPRFDPEHAEFDPVAVLELLDEVGEEPEHAVQRFREWIQTVSAGRPVVGITDTVFFDGGHINYAFGQYSEPVSPFGWAGLDLDSVYRGYAGRADASLKELDLPKPLKLHRADHDAAYLAERARVVLYEKMGWK
jgi:DNA polymerase III epsilon subunit-like protein